MQISPPTRYLPQAPFPAYAHLPGKTIHPLKPGGHSYGQKLMYADQFSMNSENPWDSPPFLYALDLFNYAYYWESHVYWEELWHQVGRQGDTADFLKALIKLAAAGLKLRMGQVSAASGHRERACELFSNLMTKGHQQLLGLSLAQLNAYQKLDLLQLAQKNPALPPLIINQA